MDAKELSAQAGPKAPEYPPPPVPPPPLPSLLLLPPPPPPPPPILPPTTPPPPPPPPPVSPPSSTLPGCSSTAAVSSKPKKDDAEVDMLASLKAKLEESEQNLKCHKEKMTEQQNVQVLETIRSCENEVINRMSIDCGIRLDEFSDLLTSLDRDHCSVMSLNRARQWVMSKCVTVKSIEAVLRFLTATINQKHSSARLKLHLLYLVNEMFGVWIKKNAAPFLTLVKQYLPIMYAGAYCQVTDEAIIGKMEYLKNFWICHNYVVQPEIDMLNDIDATLHKYLESQKQAFSSDIAKVVERFLLQHRQYEGQHENFVRYVQSQIQTIENAQKAADNNQRGHQYYDEDVAVRPAGVDAAAKCPRMATPVDSVDRHAVRSCGDGSVVAYGPSAPPQTAPQLRQFPSTVGGGAYGQQFVGGGPPFGHKPPLTCRAPSRMLPPRFYPNFGNPGGGVRPFRPGGGAGDNGFRPWPGNSDLMFAGGGGRSPMPIRWDYEGGPFGSPPPPLMQQPPSPLPLGASGYPMPVRHPIGSGSFQDFLMGPLNRGPYQFQPAGLMLTTVRLDDEDYRALDPTRLRYSHLPPADEQALLAMDAFYRRPNHEHPRDSAGWERTGMYEYYRSKRNAVQHKKELRRERGYDSRSPQSSLSSSSPSSSDSVTGSAGAKK